VFEAAEDRASRELVKTSELQSSGGLQEGEIADIATSSLLESTTKARCDGKMLLRKLHERAEVQWQALEDSDDFDDGIISATVSGIESLSKHHVPAAKDVSQLNQLSIQCLEMVRAAMFRVIPSHESLKKAAILCDNLDENPLDVEGASTDEMNQSIGRRSAYFRNYIQMRLDLLKEGVAEFSKACEERQSELH
jgi:hypothetical protein